MDSNRNGVHSPKINSSNTHYLSFSLEGNWHFKTFFSILLSSNFHLSGVEQSTKIESFGLINTSETLSPSPFNFHLYDAQVNETDS